MKYYDGYSLEKLKKHFQNWSVYTGNRLLTSRMMILTMPQLMIIVIDAKRN